MKTAIVVSGVCRNTVISSLSWNFLPEADWYLTTWDKTQETYSNELYPSDNEISNIKEKFNKIHIENYIKFIDNCQLDEVSIINSRSYFLLNDNLILKYGQYSGTMISSGFKLNSHFLILALRFAFIQISFGISSGM